MILILYYRSPSNRITVPVREWWLNKHILKNEEEK